MTHHGSVGGGGGRRGSLECMIATESVVVVVVLNACHAIRSLTLLILDSTSTTAAIARNGPSTLRSTASLRQTREGFTTTTLSNVRRGSRLGEHPGGEG